MPCSISLTASDTLSHLLHVERQFITPVLTVYMYSCPLYGVIDTVRAYASTVCKCGNIIVYIQGSSTPCTGKHIASPPNHIASPTLL